MLVILGVVLVTWQFGNAFGGNLPSFITPCSVSDPELSACVQRVTNTAGRLFFRGFPDLDVPPMDPVKVGRVESSSPSLKIVFTDSEVSGLNKSFVVNSFKMYPDKRKAIVDFTANITFSAHYAIDGNLLILPVKGEGLANINITNQRLVVKYHYDVVPGNDGVDHLNITSFKHNYTMQRAHFDFNKLFGDGDEELSRTLLSIANENWESLMKDIAPPVVRATVAACVNIVNKFFAAVPLSELVLP